MDPRSVTAGAQRPALPAIPRAIRVAWRLAPLADRRRIDAYLRFFGASSLPIGVNAGRLGAMGLPSDVCARALRRVRSINDWDMAWTWAAQWFLGEARTFERAGQPRAAALAQRRAALAYHVAGMLVFEDPRKIRALRAAASSLYARSLPILRPEVQRVDIPWRTARLPGFLVLPDQRAGPAPLVVLLNGASTSKEETILWSDGFLAHGLAVLALDWPGSGESALTVRPTHDCDDFSDGVLAMAELHPGIAAGQIALLGFSLGGALAAMTAANDRRIGAVVAVTPPYDARPWLRQAQPLLRRHLVTLAGGEPQLERMVEAFALPGVVERMRCPVLIIGAGRDLVAPPEEAMRYCAAAGPRGSLLWYPDGSHGVYEMIPDWTDEAARWIVAALSGISLSTQVDDRAAAAPS